MAGVVLDTGVEGCEKSDAGRFDVITREDSGHHRSPRRDHVEAFR
jgi:hypothetical protein